MERREDYGALLEKSEGILIDESLRAYYIKLSADQGNARAQCYRRVSK
jgi:hypothetical protein